MHNRLTYYAIYSIILMFCFQTISSKKRIICCSCTDISLKVNRIRDFSIIYDNLFKKQLSKLFIIHLNMFLHFEVLQQTN